MTVKVLPSGRMTKPNIIGPSDHPNKKDIEFLIDQRMVWKKAKNFERADEVRKVLQDKYKVVLRDFGSSCEWKVDDYVQPKAPISDEWLIVSKVYAHFIPSGIRVDLSEEALWQAYIYETKGVGEGSLSIFSSAGVYNGYIVGKRYLDVTLSMWQDDIQEGLITKWEIINEITDPTIKTWIAKRLGVDNV